MVRCPCIGGGGSDGSRPKTINIFLGYFFMVNFCLGTGFLGVPYSFFYSGYLAAVPTLALAAFLTWLSSTWLLEVIARAQVVDVCVGVTRYFVCMTTDCWYNSSYGQGVVT